jgi:hypothetical protein
VREGRAQRRDRRARGGAEMLYLRRVDGEEWQCPTLGPIIKQPTDLRQLNRLLTGNLGQLTLDL